MRKFTIEIVRRGAPNSEYVGRPSPLGNPFVMTREEARDEVCDKYARWFDAQVAAQNDRVMNELRRLWRVGTTSGVLRLACYCAPKRCHAETIARYLREHQEREHA